MDSALDSRSPAFAEDKLRGNDGLSNSRSRRDSSRSLHGAEVKGSERQRKAQQDNVLIFMHSAGPKAHDILAQDGRTGTLLKHPDR